MFMLNFLYNFTVDTVLFNFFDLFFLDELKEIYILDNLILIE